MKGYRDPTRQARRWEAQTNAWTCPNGCGHDVVDHKEYPSKWVRSPNGPVEVHDPRYRPGLFSCRFDGCNCEVDAS